MARAAVLDFLQNFRFRVSILDEGTDAGGRPGAGPILPGPRLSDAGGALSPLTGYAAFMRVTMPSMSAEMEEIKEGNWEFMRKVITRARVDNVTFERGVSVLDSDFWKWTIAAIRGEVGRKTLLLEMMGRWAVGANASTNLPTPLGGIGIEARPVFKSWALHECLPGRVRPASDLDGGSPEISIAELEMTVNWMEEKPLGATLLGSLSPLGMIR